TRCAFQLKINPHRHIEHRLLIKERIHLPTRIEPQEVPQQRTANPKTIPAGKRPYPPGLQQYIKIVIGWTGNDQLGPLQPIVLAVPCGSEIKELNDREIAEEGIIDRLVEKRGKDREPELTVDNEIVVPVSEILVEPAKIGGQRLDGIGFILGL